MNQLDPKTGILNYNIGQELLKRTSGGDTLDFATERERTETSAHLHGEYVTSNGGAEGYLGQYSVRRSKQRL